jgi:hypothetical protein
MITTSETLSIAGLMQVLGCPVGRRQGCNSNQPVYFSPVEADPSDHASEGVGLRPLACWVCGFESRGGHGSLSLVSGVCCQVEVAATDQSLVHRCPSECGVSECDLEGWILRSPGSLGAVAPCK